MLVWAAQRETPLLACASHTFPLDITPALDTVAVFRFLSSLTLLSPCPPAPAEKEEEATAASPHITLLSCSVPGAVHPPAALLPCVFATTALFHVAVLAVPTGGAEAPPGDGGVLRWIALGVARSLHPASYHVQHCRVEDPQSSLHHHHHYADATASTMARTHTTSDLATRLALFWEGERVAAQAAAAAMDRYGAQEVLAEGSKDTTLQRLLETSRQRSKKDDDEATSVATAAVTRYLARWWWPFVAAEDATSPKLQLMGYFSHAAPSPANATTLRGVVVPHAFAIASAHRAALDGLAAVYEAALQQRLLSRDHCNSVENGASPPLLDILVVRQRTTHALVAIEMDSDMLGGVKVFQVATVSDASPGPHDTAAFHSLDAHAVFQNRSTLWCSDILQTVC